MSLLARKKWCILLLYVKSAGEPAHESHHCPFSAFCQRGIFWAVGLCTSLLFPTLWMLFFTEISQQRTRQSDIFFGVMTAIMVGLGLWCALSGDVRFVATDAGRQFVYAATPPFLTMLAVYGFLASLQILSAIRWYRESLLKRRRKEARIFYITLAITGTLALPFDFLVPTLMGRAIVPLTSVIMIFASVRLYWVMKATGSLVSPLTRCRNTSSRPSASPCWSPTPTAVSSWPIRWPKVPGRGPWWANT